VTLILTILAEIIFISLFILVLYRFKSRIGLAPLYVLIGSNLLFPSILSTKMELEILGGLSILISPTIIFTSSLFAILLIYVKEGIHTTQRFILSIILANLSLTFLIAISNWQETMLNEGISTIFYFNFRILIAGIISLIFVAFIMVILYEFLFTRIKWLNLYLRIVLTLVIILIFDSITFMSFSFWESPNFESKLMSQLFGNSIAAFFFASVLWAYLRYWDKEIDSKWKEKGKEDIFSILTYKGRLEKLQTEKEISDEQFNRDLLAQNEALQKANTELDHFVYSASHDLRAPLKSVIGLADILYEKLGSKKDDERILLDMMRNSVVKLDSFIEDILDHSRNARLEMRLEKLNFDEIIEDCKRNHKFMEGAENVILNEDIKLESAFVSDLGRMKFILNNLISNAVKYHDSKSTNSFVLIKIRGDQDKALIEVSDNGIGIAPKDHAKIFEMFYRATKLSTGSGLGMYIVSEALAKLGGTIHLESELGKGTKFTVMVPNQLALLN